MSTKIREQIKSQPEDDLTLYKEQSYIKYC